MMNALVIVDVPAKQVNKPYTYSIPSEFEAVIERGERVLVPFVQRLVLGFIVDLIDEVNLDNIKPISEVLDLVPILSGEMLELSKRIAIETSSFLITVLKAMIPNALGIKYSKTLRKIKDIETSYIDKYFTTESMKNVELCKC